MGGGKNPPKPKPLPAPPDPNADAKAKEAAGLAKTNEKRRSLAAASEGDSTLAPTSKAGLSSTLGGGSGATA